MVFSGKTTKVFLLATTLSTGGAEKVVRALTLGLPRHGFDTNVLCLHGMGQVGLELSDLGASVRYKLSRGRFDPTVLVRLARIFRRDREAILFTLDHHDAIFWGALASLFAGIRYRVLSVHSTGLWAKGSSFNFMDRLVMPFYNRVVALADLHRQYLERREGIDSERIALIANGVDTGRFKPIGSDDDRERVRDSYSIPTGNFVVTIIAAMRPEKNHEMFLRSAAEISSRIENFTFLVVGEGKEARKLQDLAVELSLWDTVRFMGLRDDVPGILSISDVSVLCSYPVVETFPLSVLESMASGVPVVATSVGSIPQMLSDGEEGFLIPPGEVGALTEALLTLERDPGRRRTMGEKGRKKVVEGFSEERMVERYAELFGGLLKGEEKG